MTGLLVGCSTEHYFVNRALGEQPPAPRYAINKLDVGDNSDSLLVMLSFSGGGYRAAALSYGVLEALAETKITWEGKDKRLLDEVDLIASVSGGSLTAAYYGLFRDEIFKNFELNVLSTNLQSAVVARALSPRGLWRQTSSRLGRSDFLQEVLDEKFFKQKTYADLPQSRPMLFINATEMKSGERFEFSQDQFDLLCSDMSSFPIARAVAASMAAPVILSPITIWNYTSVCPSGPKPLPLHSGVAQQRYVHLLDGGLHDNTGIKTALEIAEARGGIVGMAQAANMHGIKKRVFIIVNAQRSPDFPGDDTADTPGIYRQLKAFIDIPIDLQTSASVQELYATIEKWKEEVRRYSAHKKGDAIDPDLDFYIIEINLNDAKRKPEWHELENIPINLSLNPSQIFKLKAYAKEMFFSSPDWLRFLKDVNGH